MREERCLLNTRLRRPSPDDVRTQPCPMPTACGRIPRADPPANTTGDRKIDVLPRLPTMWVGLPPPDRSQQQNTPDEGKSGVFSEGLSAIECAAGA